MMKNNTMRPIRICAAVLVVCILMFSAVGCAPTAERYEATRLDLFDTVTTLIAYTQSEEEFNALRQLVFEELVRLDALFDVYDGDPEGCGLAAVNAQAGVRAVEVDPDVLALVLWAKEAEALTQGVLDASAGRVCLLWQQAREAAKVDPDHAEVPSEAALQEALQHRGMDHVQVDTAACTVYLDDPNIWLDVGALAKGFTADRVMAKIKEAGFEHVMLNLGGNVITAGQRADGSAWQVGLRDPQRDGLLMAVPASDVSVVTSGGYERRMTVGDKTYHHIIDLSTGMPAERWAQVTVMAPCSAEADLLTTTLFILDEAEGRKLLAEFEDASACYVGLDGTIMKTEGWPR